MKRIRIVGACLVAVFAFSAVVVSAASANSFAPEFTKCVKAAKAAKGATHKYEGHFNNKECSEPGTEAEGHGKYERTSAVGTEFTGKSKTTTFKVKGAGGKVETITCKKDTVKGVIITQSQTEDTITFEGCTNEKHEACGVGGKIVSPEEYGVLLRFLNEAETETGVFSESPVGPFSCGTESFEVEGGLVGSATSSSKGITFTYAVNGSGEQKNQLFYSEGNPLGPVHLSTEPGEAEATVVGAEALKAKGVYIVV